MKYDAEKSSKLTYTKWDNKLQIAHSMGWLENISHSLYLAAVIDHLKYAVCDQITRPGNEAMSLAVCCWIHFTNFHMQLDHFKVISSQCSLAFSNSDEKGWKNRPHHQACRDSSAGGGRGATDKKARWWLFYGTERKGTERNGKERRSKIRNGYWSKMRNS